MENFTGMIDRFLVPVASKLNNQRHVAAVRDAFMYIFPLTIASSIVILINNLFFSPDGFIARVLRLENFFPNLSEAQAVLASAANGTIGIMALFIAFTVAYLLAKENEGDELLTGLTSLSVFMIMYPAPFASDTVNAVETTYLGAQGLFVAIIISCIIGELLPKLASTKKLQVKMPELVPPAVSRSFSAMIPMVLVIMGASILNYIILRFAPGGLNELIYSTIQTPLRNLGGNIFGVLLIALIQNILWVVGIHGPNTLNAIRSAIFTEADQMNLLFINEGGSLNDVPYKETWVMLNDAFANMGGSGMTLGLIIAIFVASKRSDYREIAKISFVPGLFNINEPLIFGLPIVLNPILAIPFILTPIVNILIGYLATVVLQIIPPVAIGVPWTTPGPLIPFLGTGGNFLALLIGLICLVVSILIYLPFVIASNRAADKELLIQK